MRVLLDECVNPRVAEAFSKHEVQTVKSMGWTGITNGKLMSLAQDRFEVFVTVDRNIQHQQNLSKIRLGIIVITVPDNKIKHFRPIFSLLLRTVETIGPGQVVHLVSLDN